MSRLIGGRVREPNFVFRFCAIIFLGVLGMGISFSWKSSMLMAAEYQEIPVSKQMLEIQKENREKQAQVEARVKLQNKKF